MPSELSKFALLSKAKPALRTHRSGNEETTMRPKRKMETHFRFSVTGEMDSTRKTIPVRPNNPSRKIRSLGLLSCRLYVTTHASWPIFWTASQPLCASPAAGVPVLAVRMGTQWAMRSQRPPIHRTRWAQEARQALWWKIRKYSRKKCRPMDSRTKSKK